MLGLEPALKNDPRPNFQKTFDDRDKAKIVAMVCSNPPEGFDRWTLELIQKNAQERGIVEKISKETVRIILKEHDLKR